MCRQCVLHLEACTALALKKRCRHTAKRVQTAEVSRLRHSWMLLVQLVLSLAVASLGVANCAESAALCGIVDWKYTHAGYTEDSMSTLDTTPNDSDN